MILSLLCNLFLFLSSWMAVFHENRKAIVSFINYLLFHLCFASKLDRRLNQTTKTSNRQAKLDLYRSDVLFRVTNSRYK